MISMSTVKKKKAHRCGSFVRHRASRARLDFAWSFGDNHREECGSFGKDFSVTYGSVLTKAMREYPLIAMDYDVLSGSPRIAGTRVPVYMVLDAVQYYGSIEGVNKSYPELTTDQVKQALNFAGAVLEQPIEHEP
jgi:uncharacterized protein (DUF433 family)